MDDGLKILAAAVDLRHKEPFLVVIQQVVQAGEEMGFYLACPEPCIKGAVMRLHVACAVGLLAPQVDRVDVVSAV